MRMTATEEIVETELERVERWRARELMRAGYDSDSATALASRLDIDLHTATDLLESGCPADLALQILL
jgi:succinylglutamate desuccinylase